MPSFRQIIDVLGSAAITLGAYIGFVPLFHLLDTPTLTTVVEVSPIAMSNWIDNGEWGTDEKPLLDSSYENELLDRSVPSANPKPDRMLNSSATLPILSTRETSDKIENTETVKVPIISPPMPKRKGNKGKKCKRSMEGVQNLGDKQYAIQEKLLQKYTHDLEQAKNIASVVWAKDAKGRKRGVRIRGIRCASPLRAMGFRKGDVVTLVNGEKVNNLPRIMRAYSRLRNSKQLKIRIVRNGTFHTLRYKKVG